MSREVGFVDPGGDAAVATFAHTDAHSARRPAARMRAAMGLSPAKPKKMGGMLAPSPAKGLASLPLPAVAPSPHGGVQRRLL